MNVVRRFRSIWKWLTPGWLQQGQGELVQFVHGIFKDAYAERMTQAAYLHYPSTCIEDSDALDLHGRSRGLPRGVYEANEDYAARLVGWRYPKGHRTRGTPLALLDQFQLALRGTHHVIVDARNRRTESGSYPSFATPNFQAVGSPTTGSGAISVAWPAHLTGDRGVLVAWSANQTVATPSGWDLLGTAGVGTPGVLGGASVRMTVFTRVAASAAEANAAVADSGVATGGIILTYRGPNFSIVDFAIAASADVTSTAMSTPAHASVTGTGLRKVAIFAAADAATSSGYTSSAVPSGWSERFDSSAGAIFAAADALLPAGADGGVSATLSIARRSVGAYLILSTPTPDTWDWDAEGLTPHWARYWLVCRSIGTPWTSFSDPGWIAAWGNPQAVLAGGGITFGELSAVVKLASNRTLGWTPAGTVANTLVLYFANDPFPEPGGNWDVWANRDTRYRYVALHPTVS